MARPKVGTARTEKRGVSALKELVYRAQCKGGLGFVYRDQEEKDVGIDGHIEIVEQETDEHTGQLVGVQVKTGRSYQRQRMRDGWIVYVDKSTVEYWRGYALPVLLALVDVDAGEAYWVLASSGEFPETKTKYKIFVPRAQRVDAGAAAAIANLATTAPGIRQRALASELSRTTSADLERYWSAWREGRREGARAWLSALLGSPTKLETIETTTVAGVFRLAAVTALQDGGNLDSVRAWAEQARQRDPSFDDASVRATLRFLEGDLQGGLQVLANSQEPGAHVLRASTLVRTGHPGAAEKILNTILGLDAESELPRDAGETTVSVERLDAARVTDTDRADAWRAYARMRLAFADLPGALRAVQLAEATAASDAEVRALRAVMTYFEGLIPEAVPRDVPAWPRPLPRYLVPRDERSAGCFKDAAERFGFLLQLDWSKPRRRQLEAWRLAALLASSPSTDRALAFAREVLGRDPGHPWVLVWGAAEDMPLDFSLALEILAAEIERTEDFELVTAYLAARMEAGRLDDLGAWLDTWRDRFRARSADEVWAFWRARIHAARGEHAEAKRLCSEIGSESAFVVQADVLRYEARRTGDSAPLAELLDAAALQTENLDARLEAAQLHATAGRWSAVAPYIDELLRRVPTPPVRRLAIFTRFNTGNMSACASLLDDAIASESADPQAICEVLTFRRMRAQVRLSLSDIPGAILDFQAVVAIGPGAADRTKGRGATEATACEYVQDVLSLARAHFVAGQAHELATCARRLRHDEGLQPSDALMLADMLLHDDPSLACDLWRRAMSVGVADAEVPKAVSIGFQLGLDDETGSLHSRMAFLAASGAAGVEQVGIEEVLARHRGWVCQRDEMLDLYRRGELPTHLMAEVLGQPLVHFYRVLPAMREADQALMHRPALLFRDGSRRVGSAKSDSAGDLARAGRLAMDMSSLLLAAHLDALDAVEEAFKPIRLPALTIVSLKEQRDKLKPHQPSRIETARLILRAQQREDLRCWDGQLPGLEPEERNAAGNWADWVALLERCRRENAFLLDLPLTEESKYGRPATVAGSERLSRLTTVKDVRAFLRHVGALHVSGAGARAGEDDGEACENPPCVPLFSGAVLYLTDSGAEALADAGLLPAVTSVFAVRVNSADQARRRASLDQLADAEAQVSWIEALIRRVSDGLLDGRYALLPPESERSVSEETLDSRTAVDLGSGSPSVVENSRSEPQAEPESTLSDEEGGDAAMSTTSGHAHPQSVERDGESQDRASRPLSLTLRCLMDVIGQPPGTLDAVWVDDRWVNRRRFAGSTRITDVVEVLTALAAVGRLSRSDLWDAVYRLRACNARAVPLSSEEILHHLRGAPVADGHILETPALRLLRRSAAGLVSDVGLVRVPSQEQLEAGDMGELDLARSYTTSVQDALVAIWETRDHASDDPRLFAESRWIVGNLYVDLGMIRAHVFDDARPQLEASALDAAALLMNAIRLLAPNRRPDAADEVGSRAAAYANWVYEATIAGRASRDATFQQALMRWLRRMLLDSLAQNEAGAGSNAVGESESMGRERLAAREVARLLYEAWPEAVRKEVGDAEVLRCLGIRVLSALVIGRWSFESEPFALGVAKLLRDETASVDLVALGDGGQRFGLSREGCDEFILTATDSGVVMRIHDVAMGVLDDATPECAQALEALRRDVDMSVLAWGKASRVLLGLDPSKRFLEVERYRREAIGRRYDEMASRWSKQTAVHVGDFLPPPPPAVEQHLRIAPVVDDDAHGCGGGASRSTEAGLCWMSAATTLLQEEGLEVAFDRLSGVPVPMPDAIRQALEALGPDERRRFARRLIRMPSSPIGFAHVVKALAWMGAEDRRYLRLARRLARQLVNPEGEPYARLLQCIAVEAYSAARAKRGMPTRESESGGVSPENRTSNDNARTEGEDGDSRADDRLTASQWLAIWYHAHSVVTRMMAERIDPSGLVSFLNDRAARRTDDLFRLGDVDGDLADPRLLTPVRFAMASLQYASNGTTLLEGADELLVHLGAAFVHPGAKLPHLDLIRDNTGRSNVLDVWVQPAREQDGSIVLGSWPVVSPERRASSVIALALDEIDRTPTSDASWMLLEVATGGDVITGAAGCRFSEIVGRLDLLELMLGFESGLVGAVTRLARQANHAADGHDPDGNPERARLRDALYKLGTPDERTTLSTSATGVAGERGELAPHGQAALHGLYVLAQAFGSPTEIMRAFASDLAGLAGTNASYLESLRGILEHLVIRRPVREAQALVGLLLQARGT